MGAWPRGPTSSLGAVEPRRLAGARHVVEQYQQQQQSEQYQQQQYQQTIEQSHQHHGGEALAAGALGATAGAVLGSHQAHQEQQPPPTGVPIFPAPPPPGPVLLQPTAPNNLTTADILESVQETSGGQSQELAISAATGAGFGLATEAALQLGQNIPPQPEIPPPPPPNFAHTLPEPVVIQPPPQQPYQLPLQPPPTSGSINIPPPGQLPLPGPSGQMPFTPPGQIIGQPSLPPGAPCPPQTATMPINGGAQQAGNQVLSNTFPFAPTPNQPMVHDSLDELFPRNPHA